MIAIAIRLKKKQNKKSSNIISEHRSFNTVRFYLSLTKLHKNAVTINRRTVYIFIYS